MRSTRYRGGGAAVSGGEGFTDGFALAVKVEDTSTAPVDDGTFALAAAYGDTVDVQSEAVELAFPAPDFADTSVAPSDADSFTLRVWLSATTQNSTNGVTNPANADSANNGTVATYTSAALGDVNPRTTSTLGANLPTAVVTQAIFRGWFKSVNTLTTSTTLLKMHSTTAAFADITMFSNAASNTTVDHLSGDFAFDLVAAGVNTLAKLQSCQLMASTQDAVAGVTPAVLTVDAGALEVVGAFI